MHARFLLLLLGALALSACANDGDSSAQPKMKQVAHTNPVTGQTTYTYRPVDSTAQ